MIKHSKISCDIKLYIYFFVVGMDHVRVHPKFLHSNATSHKWALGGKSCSFLVHIVSKFDMFNISFSFNSFCRAFG